MLGEARETWLGLNRPLDAAACDLLKAMLLREANPDRGGRWRSRPRSRRSRAWTSRTCRSVRARRPRERLTKPP